MTPSASVGIGLRSTHYASVLEDRPQIDFLEVHSENFFFAGGASMRVLDKARAAYPISLHGVGLSPGSADSLSDVHLDKLAALVARVEPALVSEHLCWGAVQGLHLNDLLPFPYTQQALCVLAERVDKVQNRLGRPILIENVSAYLSFRDSEMSEFEFLAELVRRSGCSLLLDLNNLYVNACNFDMDPVRELESLPAHAIGEIHLAGHTRDDRCLIDTHSAPVCEAVSQLYAQSLARFGNRPTLIEWDTDIPPLDVLLTEAGKARAMQAAGKGGTYA